MFKTELVALLLSGPDAQSNHTVHLPFPFDSSISYSSNPSEVLNEVDAQSRLDIRFYASELRLRGMSCIVQPHLKYGNVFCWNGEVLGLYLTVITSFDI